MKNSIIALAVFVLSTPAWAQDRPAARLPEGIVATRDIEYASAGDISLKLDLYTPKEASDARRPLVVWIHGGAWRAGDKRQCPAIRLVNDGYVVASVNYRLTDQAIYPAQIEDCKAAIRWLRANAEKYQIDPQRIGAWGSSAGGHLVALLGTAGDVAELSDPAHGNADYSSRVQAVCNFFGPTDLLQMDAHALDSAPFKHDAPNSPESLLIGGPIQEHPDKAAKANPITYVTADDPPFLIVHGDQDPLVPMHQSQLLAEALAKAGVSHKLHIVEGAGHGFGRNQTVNEMVDEFFAKTLKP